MYKAMEETKYALITGASRGIGRAIATAFAKKGYHVIINYTSDRISAEETLERILQDGGNASILKFDVTDAHAVSAALFAWKSENPDKYISIIVNNAGIRRDNLMMWMTGEDWNKVISTSLNGFFNVTQPLLKDMIIRKWGRIINIASLSGIKGMPGQTNYSAAKGGLIAATKALAQEVARKGITVNAIAPGFIKTDMTKDLDENNLKKIIPAGHFGKAEDIAGVAVFLASDAAAYINGETISVNGGIYT